MIVTCERCATQFQLDDSRVPETGVRVRCSRCKHAFQVERPATSEHEKIHRVAQRALEEAEPGPDITADLPPSAVVEPPAHRASGAGGRDPASDLLADDESDWEFNDGGGSGAAEARGAAESAVDALLAGAPRGASPAARGPLDDELDEGDALDLELDTGPARGAGADDLALETSAPAPGGDLELEEPSAPSGAEPRAAGPDASGDELGSPADWDIFDAPAPPPPPAPAVSVGRDADPPVERRAAFVPEVHDAPEEGGVWLPRIAGALGWLATAGLCTAALVIGLAPRPPAAASTEPVEVAGLHVDQVSARWVDNASHGPLYVVSGRLWNHRDVRVPREGVVLVLRDAEGRTLGKPVSLGPALPPRLLREERLIAIREAQDRSGPDFPAQLFPAQRVSFEAVVWPLPEDARRFDFAEAPGASADAPPDGGGR